MPRKKARPAEDKALKPAENKWARVRLLRTVTGVGPAGSSADVSMKTARIWIQNGMAAILEENNDDQ